MTEGQPNQVAPNQAPPAETVETEGSPGPGAERAAAGPGERPIPARAKPRLDPLAVRRMLKEDGLKARHSLSQNFLADPDVLQSILELAAPAPGSRVLEVGPGLGVLTGALLEAGAIVTAVELDRRLAERLRGRHDPDIEAGCLRLVEGDILDQDIPSLMEAPYEVVANVPYHITSPILHRFLDRSPRPARMVLMVQREVAERIAAAPGGMSYLSVFVQYHAEVRIAFVVPRSAFEPAPDVDSAVIEIRTRQAGPGGRDLDEADEADLWRLVQAGFHERRKKLHNVLSRQLPVPADIVAGALEAAGIDGDRRPQTLSVEEWLVLHEALGPLPSARAADPTPAGPRARGGRPASDRRRPAGDRTRKGRR